LNGRGVGVRFEVEAREFLFPVSTKLALGPIQLPIQWVQDVKRQKRENDNSPPSNVEAKNGGYFFIIIIILLLVGWD
jgi:hypothetical protein